MTTGTRCALVILGLGLLAACSSSDTTDTTNHAFDGTWVACRNDGVSDFREVLTIAGPGFSFNTIGYATNDLTCDGDGVAGTPLAVTAVYGAQVTAGLEMGNVLATQVDVTLPGTPVETFYTLLYRDTAATPDALHLGDDSGLLDGSTPALRPVTLQYLPRALQATPVASDLTGVWKYCPAGLDEEVVTIDAASGAFDFKRYSGDCGVGTTVVEQVAGTFTLGTPVYASLGEATVTAFAVDLAVTIPVTANMYTTLWVNTEATPRRMYHGDDRLHGMSGSSPSLRPRVLLPDASLKQ